MGRVRRTLAAVLGLVVVCLNLLAPLGMPPMEVGATALAAEATPGVDPVLGPLVICSTRAALLAGADGKPIDAPAGNGHAPHCAFCVPLLSGGVTAPDGTEPVHYRADENVLRLRPQVLTVLMTEVRSENARPRGPPLRRV